MKHNLFKLLIFFFVDERMAVENTTIPEHLEQMIEVLKIEEQEYGYSSAVSIILTFLKNAKNSFKDRPRYLFSSFLSALKIQNFLDMP